MEQIHPEANRGFAIYHDLMIKSSSEQVFQAVSTPEHLIKWWPLKCSGSPETGGIYNFHFGPEYDWYGRVINYTPNETFHVKMTQSDADWDFTSFGFDLQEVEGHVQVRFWHKGWPECNEHFRRSSYCWAILLQGLKNYVENGIIIPFEERE